MRIKRFLWRSAYWLRFQLFQRHRHKRLVLEWVAGRPFLILPQVFNPNLFLTSDFMVATFNETLIPPGSSVLDMGTGSGVGAIFAAQWAQSVMALDINPEAVRCARINALLNRVDDRVEVREGDLFTAVGGQQFDVILFNPPYFYGKPQDNLDRAFHAEDVLERFAGQLSHHLKPDGYALLLLSSTGDEAHFLNLFRQQAYQIETAAQKRLPSEVISLYKVIRSSEHSPAAALHRG